MRVRAQIMPGAHAQGLPHAEYEYIVTCIHVGLLHKGDTWIEEMSTLAKSLLFTAFLAVSLSWSGKHVLCNVFLIAAWVNLRG